MACTLIVSKRVTAPAAALVVAIASRLVVAKGTRIVHFRGIIVVRGRIVLGLDVVVRIDGGDYFFFRVGTGGVVVIIGHGVVVVWDGLDCGSRSLRDSNVIVGRGGGIRIVVIVVAIAEALNGLCDLLFQPRLPQHVHGEGFYLIFHGRGRVPIIAVVVSDTRGGGTGGTVGTAIVLQIVVIVVGLGSQETLWECRQVTAAIGTRILGDQPLGQTIQMCDLATAQRGDVGLVLKATGSKKKKTKCKKVDTECQRIMATEN